MIECQRRFPEFPGEPWEELEASTWQLIRLHDIYRYRFRFHGQLVEKRRYLCAYLEKEIIYAKLRGLPLSEEMAKGQFKK